MMDSLLLRPFRIACFPNDAWRLPEIDTPFFFFTGPSLSMRHVIVSVFREEHAKVFAYLFRVLRDFDAAEDALQDAFVAALRTWPEDGVPDRPAAWITRVAHNHAVSARRRAQTAARKQEVWAADQEEAIPSADDIDIPDERLRLIFTCCHPALSEEAQVALTLQTVCGLETPTIARLFLVPEATVAQRLVRAKRKIVHSGIPYVVPPPESLDERVRGVLAVVYLLFTEGYASSESDDVLRPALVDEAIRLGQALSHLMPRHAEARGLTALMLLHDARRPARLDRDGEILALEEQDRSRYDAALVREGLRLLDEALSLGAPGPYQAEAAIAALHSTPARAEDTDWPQIAALYDTLFDWLPSPSVALARAVARGMADGPDAGLALLDALASAQAPSASGLVWAARADLLRRAGQNAQAAAAYDQALSSVADPRRKRFLERRRAMC